MNQYFNHRVVPNGVYQLALAWAQDVFYYNAIYMQKRYKKEETCVPSGPGSVVFASTVSI